MSRAPVKQNNKDTIKTFIIAILIALLVIVTAWHIILPLLGVSIAISAAAFGIAVGTVVLICIATMLFFIFTGLGIFIAGGVIFTWSVLAIILFPLLLPILLPVLLLMLVVAFITRNKR